MRSLAALALLATAVAAEPAAASGIGEPMQPWVDADGGPQRDQPAFYAGNVGIVLPHARPARLFIAWRGLHGLATERAIGEALDQPCCGTSWDSLGDDEWLEARRSVLGLKDDQRSLVTSRPGSEPYEEVPNCLAGAFETAAATLRDRVARHGSASPWVRAWLAGQDAVFASCDGEADAPPPLPHGAPDWLRADRAYQLAAIDFYGTSYERAAAGFAAIARDVGSPWRSMAPYLSARALGRRALADRTAANVAAARAALRSIAEGPTGTFGRESARGFLKMLAFRDRPAGLAAELAADLSGATLPQSAASDFKDLWALTESPDAPRSDFLDWIATIGPDRLGPDDPADRARARWQSTADPAWLIAAMAVSDAGDPRASALVLASKRLTPTSPAFLTAAYHRFRLTLTSADPAALRREIDRILARRDLSTVTRNLFSAQRALVAANLADFARFSLRARMCEPGDRGECWPLVDDDAYHRPGLFDRDGSGGVGFGDEVRWTIDNMTLSQRVAFASMTSIPAPLHLDVALTTFVRAVQLQNRAATDATARLLMRLLPQMRADFARVLAEPPGADRRFAEFFVLAKIPGARADLGTSDASHYVRPEGAIREFQGHWPNWYVAAAGRPASTIGSAAVGYAPGYISFEAPDRWRQDLVCHYACGAGSYVPRLAPFVTATVRQVARERGYLLEDVGPGEFDKRPPSGAASVWEEVLAYARAHPRDPRSPEALHWLIHVGRWGASNNRSGKRAFELLHRRYPESLWAKRNPYHYD